MPQPYTVDELNLPADGELHQLLQRCPDIALLRYSDNEAIVHSEDDGDHCFLLLRGSCLVEGLGDESTGRPGKAIAVLHGDESAPVMIGEIAALGTGARTANVKSALNSWVMRLSPTHFEVVMSEFPGLTRMLCRQFADRLHETTLALQHFQGLFVMEAEHRSFARGDIIFRPGAMCETLYQVIDGVVRIHDAQQEYRIAGNSPRTLLEPEAYFFAQPHQVTAEAVADTVLLAVSASSRPAAIRHFPEELARILEEMGQ